ncbi:hypothetical protein SAMN05216325_11676 [Nitrosomonas marina]|uniref:Uncharacterized protein n=1 Tax=Nitrosomonas marina TaxID=917 RepID=A0A1H8G848_9PROT|nr:hypothetical protein SAMN05216325_11676 [Nitrosomonas marina]
MRIPGACNGVIAMVPFRKIIGLERYSIELVFLSYLKLKLLKFIEPSG